MIVQVIFEFDWGNSEFVVQVNNFFGVKGNYKGYYVMMEMDEFEKGKRKIICVKF